MIDSKEKLLEAKYFLEQMKERRSEREEFKYNLSAFLSSARSVTFIMQKEFDHIPGFREWYAVKQADMKSDEMMRVFNEKRVMTIHLQPLRPVAHVNLDVREHLTININDTLVITRSDGTVQRVEPQASPARASPSTEVRTEWRWYLDEVPEKDVIALCEEHIAKLEDLLTECESRFTC